MMKKERVGLFVAWIYLIWVHFMLKEVRVGLVQEIIIITLPLLIGISISAGMWMISVLKEKDEKDGSYHTIFLAAFAGGILAIPVLIRLIPEGLVGAPLLPWFLLFLSAVCAVAILIGAGNLAIRLRNDSEYEVEDSYHH